MLCSEDLPARGVPLPDGALARAKARMRQGGEQPPCRSRDGEVMAGEGVARPATRLLPRQSPLAPREKVLRRSLKVPSPALAPGPSEPQLSSLSQPRARGPGGAARRGANERRRT